MSEAQPTDLAIVPSSSAVLVEARSSVGAISFGTTEISGSFRALPSNTPSGIRLVEARAIVPVASLVSGNRLYDNELHQRLHALRYPEIVAELRDIADLGSGRVQIEGDLTIHGSTRRQRCTAEIDLAEGTDPGRSSVVVAGNAVVDIRDFEISVPSVMMLKIYPEVTVRFRVTAAWDTTTKEVAK